MTNSLRTLYLLWLPIAFLGLVIPSRGQINAAHIFARNALADQIADLKAEFGNNVDTSLSGYDHELVGEVLKEGQQKRSAMIYARDELAKAATAVKAELGADKVDTSLDGYDLTGIDDPTITARDVEDLETIARRSLILAREDIAKDAAAVKSELGASQVDTSLEGYDLSGIDDATISARDVEDLATIARRSLILAREDIAKDAAAVKSELGASQVDTSLEGYDLSGIDDPTINARDVPAAQSTEGTFFGDVMAKLKNYGAEHEHDEDSTLTRRQVIAKLENYGAGHEHDPGFTLTRRDDMVPNKADFPADVDFSLAGYDDAVSTLTRRDDMVPNKADFPADVDFSLDGYTDDPALTKRGDLVPNKADFPADVDFSLDGYDPAALTRRDDLPTPNKADFPADVDFSLAGYDTALLTRREADEEELHDYLSELAERDVAEDDDDDDDDEGTSNDRYPDTDSTSSSTTGEEDVSAQATAAAEAARMKVRRAVVSSTEGGGSLLKKLKALMRGKINH